MSLPPMNPDKTASGISVDPRTLERVVASSRRKDGSTRKELKIRPGFTPQEDVGVFRSARQQRSAPSSDFVPGSTRPKPNPTQTENPFAQSSSAKSKSQLKNEKRREKKRAETKAWDESSDEDAEEDMREAFKRADISQRDEKDRKDTTDAGNFRGNENVYPAHGGAPEPGVAQEAKMDDNEAPGSTSILEKAPGMSGAETAAQMPGAPAPRGQGTSDAAGPLEEAAEQRQRQQREKSKPHPIQGGRQGPIGLAFPPPEDQPAKEAEQSRADKADTWRTVSSGKTGRGGQQQQQGRGRGGRGGAGGQNGQSRPNNQSRPSNPGRDAKKEETSTPSEPRVRKEHRVREGGANDMTSLASRVKNLVLDSTTGRSPGGARGAAAGKKEVPVDAAKSAA